MKLSTSNFYHRDIVEIASDQLIQIWEQPNLAHELATLRAREVDALISDLEHKFLSAHDIKVFAIGGYGRGVLLPKSDIDLLLWMPTRFIGHNASASIKDAISEFSSQIWKNKLTLSICSHTKKSLSQAIAHDITLATSILSIRQLKQAKDNAKHPNGDIEELLSIFKRRWPMNRYFAARMQQFNETIPKNIAYELQPDIKNSKGGTRTCDTIRWIYWAYKINTNQSLLTNNELILLEELQISLERFRFLLHLCSGREAEQFTFQRLQQISSCFAIKNEFETICSLLQDITITMAKAKKFLRNLKLHERIQNLVPNQDIAKQNYTAIDAEQWFTAMCENPALKYAIPFHAFDHMPEYTHSTTTSTDSFIASLTGLNSDAIELLCNELALNNFISDFGRVFGLGQFDLTHQLCVSQHCCRVFRCAKNFFNQNGVTYLDVDLSQVAAKEKLSIALACLFHDLGKGTGRNHSIVSAQIAEKFCQHCKLDKDLTQTVCWLIEHHLTISKAIQSQNIEDPEIISQHAKLIHSHKRLDLLFWLTAADLQGTNPKLWNQWRGNLMKRFYRNLWNAIDGREAMVDQHQKVLELQNLFDTDCLSFWDVDRWPSVATELVENIQNNHVTAEYLNHTPNDKTIVVTAVTGLSGNILENITVFIERNKYSILSGSISTNLALKRQCITFVLRPIVEMESNPNEVKKLAAKLLTNISKLNADKVRRHWQKPKIMRQPQVNLKQSVRDKKLFLFVDVHDKPGILGQVISAITEHQITVSKAQFSTFGGRAMDTFTIENDDAIDIEVFYALQNSLIDLQDTDDVLTTINTTQHFHDIPIV